MRFIFYQIKDWLWKYRHVVNDSSILLCSRDGKKVIHSIRNSFEALFIFINGDMNRFQCCTCCQIKCVKVTAPNRWQIWRSSKLSYFTQSFTSKWPPYPCWLSNWLTIRGTISVTANYLGSPPSYYKYNNVKKY